MKVLIVIIIIAIVIVAVPTKENKHDGYGESDKFETIKPKNSKLDYIFSQLISKWKGR